MRWERDVDKMVQSMEMVKMRGERREGRGGESVRCRREGGEMRT